MWHEPDQRAGLLMSAFQGRDIVAKVFLRGGTQILRPVGAAIEY